MARFTFTLVLTGPVDEKLDELYEAGCDDALFGEIDGVPYAEFDREASSLEEALDSAATAVESIAALHVIRGEVGGHEVFRAAGGPFITEEIAEHLADEAEAGYDVAELAKTARRGPGAVRPPRGA